MSTTASIAKKGCQSTGITEELAKRLHDSLGRKVVAIVELEAATRTENTDGDEAVTLRILTIDPAPNPDTEAHLRNLASAFHYERKLAAGDAPQLPLGDGPEPQVSQVLAAGKRLEHHDFELDPDEHDAPLCLICGGLEDDKQHHDLTTSTPDPEED